MRAVAKWILVVLWVLALAGPSITTSAAPVLAPRPQEIDPQPAALQGTSLTLFNPPGCPPGGCAAGQRINVRFNFKLEGYDPALANGGAPNVKVCLYAPAVWGVEPQVVGTEITGEVTQTKYTTVADCSQETNPLTNYTLVAAMETSLNFVEVADLLNFGFRLNKSGPGVSQLVARVFQVRTAAGGWERTADTITSPFSVVSGGATAYVANDLAACGSSSPCYVNSGDDLPAGIGTGLKDAIDAAPDLSPGWAVINVLGNYTIKSNTVHVTRPVIVNGLNNSTITYSEPGACGTPMLALLNRSVVQNLNINDGPCTAPYNRTLIAVNTGGEVVIQSNTLTGGGNAIEFSDSGSSAGVLFNHITGNSGFALFWASGTTNGVLNLVANNLDGNGAAIPVDCFGGATGVVNSRFANHNYWGGAPPRQEDAHCVITPGKELGAPIFRTNGVPGVNATTVNVTATEAEAFGGQVSYQRTGGSDFLMYIVDHGYAQPGGNPFAWKNVRSPSPCSNTWDIFLPPGAGTDATLTLGFKYDRGGTSCETVINSIQYCDQTAQAKYPLFWYDPQNDITSGWEMVGANPTGSKASGAVGQTTTCSTSDKKIRVSIDASGRPNLTGDMNFTPFMVGVPVLKEFLPRASDKTITVTWLTNNEPDLKGFYVHRSTDGISYTTISELIAPKGNALTGAYYNSVIDSNRTNNVTYYYYLEIIRNDGYKFYSEVFAIKANVATITPTPTITPTRTATKVTASSTPITPSVTTQSPTRMTTRTNTPRPTDLTRTAPALPSGTLLPFRSGTPDPTDGFIPGRTQTTPGTVSPTEGTVTPGTGTPLAMVGSATVSPTPQGTPSPAVTGTIISGAEGSSNPAWLSLLIGLLSGLACVAAAGWLWYHSAQK